MNKWLKILIILFSTVIVSGTAVYIFVYNKPHKNYERSKPDFSLRADTLFTQFLNNAAYYGQMYNGKVLEITGKISKTEISDSSAVIIFVFSQGMFGDEGIRCNMMPKFHTDAVKLVSGQEVRIKGFCAGYNGTDVEINECSFVK